MAYISETGTPEHLTWTIHRPERRNSLGTTVGSELWEKLESLDSKDNKPISLTITAKPAASRGCPIWIAGGDLKELATLTKTQGAAYASQWSNICQKLEKLRVSGSGS